MPPLRRWVQFLTMAGGFVGSGYLFVKYGTPDDEQFIQSMSPELRARYYREKEIREKMGHIMQRKIKENVDKPAWLQGSGAMRQLDREIAEEALKEYNLEQQQKAMKSQHEQLKELASKEGKA